MKRIIPPVALKATLTPGHAVAGETRRVPVGEIHVLDNLNLRVRGTPEYEEAVTEFAASIAANGFYDDKPLAGYLNADGQVVVIDGHRRLEAVQRLNEASLDPVITDVPVVLKSEDSTMADLTIAMIQSSSGRELTMFEKGIGVRRLMADGMTKEDIATRLGVTVKSVENYIAVASAPAKARDLLLDNRVTPTQVLRAKGDTKKLDAMVAKATAAGRTRARPSDAMPETATAIKRVNAGLDAVQPETVSESVPTVQPTVSTDSFDVSVVKDGVMSAVVRQVAEEIRKRVPHDQGDDDGALVNATITVTVALEQPAKPARKRKAASTPAPELTADEPVPAELTHALVGAEDDL